MDRDPSRRWPLPPPVGDWRFDEDLAILFVARAIWQWGARSCNLHADCDDADRAARERGAEEAHCYDPECWLCKGFDKATNRG